MRAKGPKESPQGRVEPTPSPKFQPGRGGGDITEFAKQFKGCFKEKIDIKKALADHAKARYAKWQRD
jgi:hypothetical protein